MTDLTAGLAAFEAKNYTNAFKLLKPIADRGDAEAQCMVANMYHLGLGSERDVLEAVKWYKKSASQGYGVASNNLAEIFAIGDRGIAIDRVEAEKWYQKSKGQKFLHSCNPLIF
jgi:TPR repeat protein